MKVKFEELRDLLEKAFLKAGLSDEDAKLLAKVHASSSRDGVYSHGLNRVPIFLNLIENKVIDTSTEPTLVKSFGIVEQYDGNFGMGVKNAIFASHRASKIAKENGIGLVALRHTNHWQRGATYSMEIANEGLIGICWSNADSVMPAWGGDKERIANNPLTIAIPYEDKDFVLDMAMSQYSLGKFQVMASAGEELPYVGGVDKDGNETKDPKAITDGGKVYPMGYWKGSGLAIALDLLVAILSEGNTTKDIDELDKGLGVGCSQAFIAIDPSKFASEDRVKEIIKETISYIKEGSEDEVTYPGERMIRQRNESLEQGVEVDEEYYNKVEDYINER